MIRVAISGGGLAGTSLMLALLQYPHVDVHIFESAPEFREAGAAIVLGPNALQALNLITPLATRYLERAGGVPQNSVRFMLAQGPHAGRVVRSREATDGGLSTITHRARLLRELLEDVPPDRMHANKKLTTITRAADGEGPLTLGFGDGSSHECDVLVGADGIHSRVRREILGEHDPATSPVPAGWWVIMTLQPYQEVRDKLGDLIDNRNPREYSWVGDGTYLIHHVTGGGDLVQFAIAAKCDPDQEKGQWQKTVTAEEIRSLFSQWPAHLNRAVVELLCKEPTQAGYFFWEHLPARSYCEGPLCVLGDAAHASTPWQGSGGGISIEDSLVLSTLLGRAQSTSEALVALQVYDEVRRPRTQRVVQSSHETGLILSGCDPDIGLDVSKMKYGLEERWDFIVRFDNIQHIDEAVQRFDVKCGKTSC